MLSVVDTVVLVGLMISFVLIAFFLRERRTSNVTDYFLARRRMSAIPAAFSISVSYLSSVGFTLYIGEIYTYGVPQYLSVLSTLLIGPVLTNYFQPRLYDSPHVSIYQHLEERFSKTVRLIYSSVFLCTAALNMGVIGYSASLTGEILAGFPFWTCALCVGLLSTAYSTLGGLKAVIWTDVCQAVIMIFFYVVVLLKIVVYFGGLAEPWQIIMSGKRIQFSFQEGPTHRYSVTSVLLSGCTQQMYIFCVSQPAVQRWRSVGSLAEAKKTAIATMVIWNVYMLLMYVTALAVYAFYARCSDPGHIVPKPEMASLTFVSTVLSAWPGIRGLCLGSILSAALSTFSSFINSMAAVTLEDFVKLRFKSLTPRQEILLSKTLTLFYGIFCTGLIFVTARSSAVIMIYIASLSVAIAPPLGIFCLSLWSRRANNIGVTAGSLVTIALLFWMSIGALMKGNRHATLPKIDNMCLSNETRTVTNSTVGFQEEPEWSFLQFLYDISFCWYVSIGLVSSIIFGYIFSWCSTPLRKYLSKSCQEMELPENNFKDDSSHTEKLLQTSQSEEIALQKTKIVDETPNNKQNTTLLDSTQGQQIIV